MVFALSLSVLYLSERSCIYASRVLILHLSTNFRLDFGTVPVVWVLFCFFHFMTKGGDINISLL